MRRGWRGQQGGEASCSAPQSTRTSNRDDRALAWFLLAFFTVWTLRATVLYAYDAKVPPGAPRMAYQAAVKFALWVVPACAYLWLTGVRRLGRGLRLTTPFGRRAALWTLVGVGFVAVDVVAARRSP